MAPKDGNELREMFFTALEINGPVAIRYPKRDGLELTMAEACLKSIPIGRGEIIQPGQAVALIGLGSMVETAISAGRRLQKQGISCTIVNARFVKPLDEELLLQLAASHQNIVTIEENVIAGGFGSSVLEFLTNQGVKGINFKILGLPDEFITHGPTELLLSKCGLDAEGVCRAVRELNLPVVSIQTRG
jgi:1-deoxy-D-xylulose-5-phosphate synthase